MMMDRTTAAIAHIEKNERGADLVSLEFSLGKWWVKVTRGPVKSRPAVHENLVDAYAIALAHFEEATLGSESSDE
jgi:hypothetical protein